MKALFWKEWRESRLLLFIGILIIIGFSLLLLFIYRVEGIAGAVGMGTASFLSCFFGAEVFSKEKGKFEFLLSSPIERKTIFFVKFLSGFLNILILLLIALALEIIIYETDGFNLLICSVKGRSLPPGVGSVSYIWDNLLCALKNSLLLYSTAFLMSILLLNTITAFFTGIGVIIIMGWLFYGISKIYSNFPPIINESWSLILLFLLLFLSYFIFTRKEIRE